ncbi:MAG: TIGR02757 family protein [Bacteroidetes bacterium]|nr:TIGR02757 family protein [Bacteroidota bacterium]
MIDNLKDFLDEKYDIYNRPDFIDSDPISIPHQFSIKEDIEIAGFLAATIAWGQRVTIINNANKMMKIMGNSPCDFIMHAKQKEINSFNNFVHRTFNGEDAAFFIKSLKNIYKNHGGLENTFLPLKTDNEQSSDFSLTAIMNFRKIFFSIDHPGRTRKHVSSPDANSSSKRLCMYLRWMVRKDKRGVDFGIWNSKLLPSYLMCPLDVHSGNVARKLGLLNRTQNDWKAVIELTTNLRKLDSKDPVKYDFALFGLGVFEKF